MTSHSFGLVIVAIREEGGTKDGWGRAGKKNRVEGRGRVVHSVKGSGGTGGEGGGGGIALPCLSLPTLSPPSTIPSHTVQPSPAGCHSVYGRILASIDGVTKEQFVCFRSGPGCEAVLLGTRLRGLFVYLNPRREKTTKNNRSV